MGVVYYEIEVSVSTDRAARILEMLWPTRDCCAVKKYSFCPYYEGHLETKERFAIQIYLLIIGKKQNMQVLSHTFTYFST